MRLFDAHNHIQDARLFGRYPDVLCRARRAGLAGMAVKGCYEGDWARVIEVVNNFEGAAMAFGVHPWFISGRSVHWAQKLEKLLTSYQQASVGEIGLDHAIIERDDNDQEQVFLTQLEIARRYRRPVSIHCRKAWGRLIELLDDFGELPGGMMIHCFGGSVEIVRELVARNAYISFSGSVTRPGNKKAGPAIRAVPNDRILIETDAPDILPVGGDVLDSLRGSQGELLNEPARLPEILRRVAALRGADEEMLAELAWRNARRFFFRS